MGPSIKTQKMFFWRKWQFIYSTSPEYMTLLIIKTYYIKFINGKQMFPNDKTLTRWIRLAREKVKFDRLLRLKKSFLPDLFDTAKESVFK